jgi:putative transposase
MGSWLATAFSSAIAIVSGPTTSAASSKSAGVRIVLTPIRAPNANAYAERFVRSIREECLDRLILFGERRLFRALHEFVAHYHGERNHQGLANELITPATAVPGATQVRCRDRLGGLLRYYYRAA